MVKKLLSDRKGAAIELAILMTVVCFAVSTIVLSAALLQYENKVQADRRLDENEAIEQIVEVWLKDRTQTAFVYEGVTYNVDTVEMSQSTESDKQETDGGETYVFYQMVENGERKDMLTITITDDEITQWKKG